MNYTPEITAYMTAQYLLKPTNETVELLVKELDKSKKSIIGKLAREGVYRRQVYTTKQGDPPVTKTEIVAIITSMLNLDIGDLEGLDKTPKLILQKLEEQLCTLLL